MDESPKQLIGTTRYEEQVEGTWEKRVDYEYVRHGVCNIFMANEPLKGRLILKLPIAKEKLNGRNLSKKLLMNIILKRKR